MAREGENRSEGSSTAVDVRTTGWVDEVGTRSGRRRSRDGSRGGMFCRRPASSEGGNRLNPKRLAIQVCCPVRGVGVDARRRHLEAGRRCWESRAVEGSNGFVRLERRGRTGGLRRVWLRGGDGGGGEGASRSPRGKGGECRAREGGLASTGAGGRGSLKNDGRGEAGGGHGL